MLNRARCLICKSSFTYMENPCTRIHVQYGVTCVSVSIIIHKDVIRDTYRTKFEVRIKCTKYEVVEVSLGIRWSMRGTSSTRVQKVQMHLTTASRV